MTKCQQRVKVACCLAIINKYVHSIRTHCYQFLCINQRSNVLLSFKKTSVGDNRKDDGETEGKEPLREWTVDVQSDDPGKENLASVSEALKG